MTVPTPHGRFGSLGMAKQTAFGIPADFSLVPTPKVWLRQTNKSGMQPNVARVRSKAAFGTFDPLESLVASKYAQFNAEFEADYAGLVFILGHMLRNNLFTANTLTPLQDDFDVNCPLEPITIQSVTPSEDYSLVDCQITKLSLKFNAANFVTGSIEGMGLEALDLAVPAVPVNSTNASVFLAQHVSATLNALPFKPENLDLTLEVPINIIDGPTGSVKKVGFARADADALVSLMANYNVRGVHALTKNLHQNGGIIPSVISFVNGTNILRFDMPRFDFDKRELTGGNGPLMTTLSGMATTDLTAPAFTIKNV